MVKNFWLFFCYGGFFFAVFGKTRMLLDNTDTPIDRSDKKKVSYKKSKMINALVQKIQLDEHGKFRYYVMFATMDISIYKSLMSLVDSMLNKLVFENFDWKYQIVHPNFINGLCL
jgi:hypothetical protein